MLTYKIQALDGAGPEGTTLYVLYDPLGGVVECATWPHPLEALAATKKFPCQRLPAYVEQDWEVDDEDMRLSPLSRPRVTRERTPRSGEHGRVRADYARLFRG